MQLYLLSVSSFLTLVAIRGDKVVVDPKKPAESRKLCSVNPILVNLTSYAGYFNVDEQLNVYLFFWFLVTEVDSKNTPLVIWLQGQPGLSSIYGLFDEHGPVYLDTNGFKTKKREHAWTNKYNVLYLDPQVNCGYSHSTSDSAQNTTLLEISTRISSAIHQFLKIFPEHKDRDLYLAGEFDASKFLTLVGYYNLKAEPSLKFNLKGLLIGGGFTFENDQPTYGEFFHSVGLISRVKKGDITWNLHFARSFLRGKQYADGLEVIGSLMEKEVPRMGFRTLFDLRDVDTLRYSLAPFIAQRTSFKNFVHAGDRSFKRDFRLVSLLTMKSVRDYLPMVLANYKLLLYTGQFDMLTPFAYTSKFISELSWPGCEMFYNKSRTNWIIDGKLLGYWKQAKNLTHVMIRNAGHMVGNTQPFALYHLLDYFVEDKFK